MKILRWLCCLVMLICAAESLAAKKIATLITPMAYSGYVTQVHYYLEILTPEGVAYGVYKQHSIMLKAENLDLVSWTGSNTAPTLKAESVQLISDSACPGLDEYDTAAKTSYWDCENITLGVYYDGPVDGCPWLISTYTDSIILMDGIGPYVGPKVHNSSCPVSVATYDISWSEDYVAIRKCCRCNRRAERLRKRCPPF